jgi:hypothetical protein
MIVVLIIVPRYFLDVLGLFFTLILMPRIFFFIKMQCTILFCAQAPGGGGEPASLPLRRLASLPTGGGKASRRHATPNVRNQVW